MSVLRRSLILASFVFSIFAAPLAAEIWLRGPVILTVGGNISNPSREGVDEANDKFFTYNEVEFSQAAEFDFAALQGLGMTTIQADFPMGSAVHAYRGPLLADVLSAAGATGDMITVMALDGYQVDLDIGAAVANGAVIALERDGKPFAIGDYGPTHLVFPRAERADLADMNDDTWVYSIYYINVE